MPDLPTISEAGAPGFEVISWYGLLAPAGTPQEIIQRLNVEAVKAMQEPEAVERLGALGAEPSDMTPADLGAFIRREIAKWGKVVRSAGIRAD